jgi:hypothetical protein
MLPANLAIQVLVVLAVCAGLFGIVGACASRQMRARKELVAGLIECFGEWCGEPVGEEAEPVHRWECRKHLEDRRVTFDVVSTGAVRYRLARGKHFVEHGAVLSVTIRVDISEVAARFVDVDRVYRERGQAEWRVAPEPPVEEGTPRRGARSRVYPGGDVAGRWRALLRSET